TMPYYVAPEQAMKDKADFARKGIARGRSAVVLTFADGVRLCAENPSTTLHKLAEIYDRIAFAGVGTFNEFDQLRIAGIRHAELEVAYLSRSNGRRAFRRLDDDQVAAALSAGSADPIAPSAEPAEPATEGGGSAPAS